MQVGPGTCRVLELVVQHGWVAKRQMKLVSCFLSKVEILSKYWDHIDYYAATALDDYDIDSDGNWHDIDICVSGHKDYWSD